jgi:hypothetical protein
VLDGLGVGRVEGRHNLRNTFKTLFAQRTAAAPFAVALYGDSVGHKVGQFVIQGLRRYFGNGGNVYPPTDTSIQGTIGATTTGTVTHSLDSATSGSADYQYLPNGGHFIMANGSTVKFGDNDHSGYNRMVAWFAKRPGDGSALVEVVKVSDNSILFTQTVALDGTNGTLVEANFASVDNTVASFLRVTATGTVCLLTCCAPLASSSIR